VTVTVKPVLAVVTDEKVGTNPVVAPEVVVIEFDAADGDELPTEFVAKTVNVYAVPAVKPVIEIVPDVAWLTEPVIEPGDEVAV
jgi:hypothetical protein